MCNIHAADGPTGRMRKAQCCNTGPLVRNPLGRRLSSLRAASVADTTLLVNTCLDTGLDPQPSTASIERQKYGHDVRQHP